MSLIISRLIGEFFRKNSQNPTFWITPPSMTVNSATRIFQLTKRATKNANFCLRNFWKQNLCQFQWISNPLNHPFLHGSLTQPRQFFQLTEVLLRKWKVRSSWKTDKHILSRLVPTLLNHPAHYESSLSNAWSILLRLEILNGRVKNASAQMNFLLTPSITRSL